MVTFRYHFSHFLPFTTGFFDLKYICMGFILSEGRKRCLVVFRYHFGTIRLDYFNSPDKTRIISLLFPSLSCHESSFLLSPVTSVTHKWKNRHLFRNSPFVLRSTFQWAPISARSADHRGYGESKSPARSRPKEEGQIHIIWILVLRGGSCP